MEEKQITIELKRPEIFILLIILGIIFIFEFNVISNTPVVFGDEGLHTRSAQYIAENKEYFVFYPFFATPLNKWMFERPPYLHFLEASLFWISGMNEILVKFLTPFVASFLIGVSVFVLVKRIYNKEVAFAAAIIAVTIPSLVTYSVLLYTDALVTFFFTLFVLTFILAIEKGGRRYWILAGVFGGIAFLTKSTAVFTLAVIVLFFLYQLYKQRSLKIIKSYAIVVGLLVLVSSGFLIRNLVYFNTPHCNFSIPFFKPQCSIDYRESTKYSYEGVTEQVGTEQNILRMGLLNYLNFAYGNILFIIFPILGGLVIFMYRRRASDILIVLTLLTFLIVLYRYFWGRAEDTARFTLQWAPIIGLVAANYFGGLLEFVRKYKYALYGLSALTLVLLIYYMQFIWLVPLVVFLLIGIFATKDRIRILSLVIFFIILFFGFASLQSKLAVMSQVKQFSPEFFKACDWAKQNLPKDARIMSNFGAATVYNCQRNNGGGGADVVLSGNLSLALSKLKSEEVTHILIPKFIISPRALSEKVSTIFINLLENNPNNFVKVYESGPHLENCMQGGCDGVLIYQIKYSV